MRLDVEPDPGLSSEQVAATLDEHVGRTLAAIPQLRTELDRLTAWGRLLSRRLREGHRLLVAGNGGSAAHGAHLVAELVGRYRADRAPASAILLGADVATATALVNDDDPVLLFERGVRAHGCPGDVFLAISTSGRSANVVRACVTASASDLTVLALTGAAPNPIARAAHDALAVPSTDTPAVQEVHQVVVHLICEAFDAFDASRTRQEGR
jgi:D-sedoheptulose 7-phosphate isomerase